jgi:hypothetical protein
VLFLADGAFWGAAGMVRTSRDFTDRETEFLSAVAPEIATAATLAVRSEASRQTADGYPAIVVVGAPRRLRGSGRAGPVRPACRRSGVVLSVYQLTVVGDGALAHPVEQVAEDAMARSRIVGAITPRRTCRSSRCCPRGRGP